MTYQNSLKLPVFAMCLLLQTALSTQAQDRAALNERASSVRALNQTIHSASIDPGRAARSSGRIINGEFVNQTVNAGEWEFTASIQDQLGHFCGGVLVSPVVDEGFGAGGALVDFVKDWEHGDPEPRMLLTAAHCMYEFNGSVVDKDSLIIFSGHVNQSMPRSRQNVTEIHVHPDYDPSNNYAHDIAVLILSEPIGGVPDGAIPRSIALPDASDGIDFKRVTAAHSVLGWGRTGSGPLSQILMSVRVPFSDQEQCKEQYEGIDGGIHRGSFCAGFVSGGFDSCQGDSGGPVTFRPSRGTSSGQLGRPLLTGIVSWGEGCALPDFAGVYTDLLKHLGWVEEKTLQHSDLFKS